MWTRRCAFRSVAQRPTSSRLSSWHSCLCTLRRALVSQRRQKPQHSSAAASTSLLLSVTTGSGGSDPVFCTRYLYVKFHKPFCQLAEEGPHVPSCVARPLIAFINMSQGLNVVSELLGQGSRRLSSARRSSCLRARPALSARRSRPAPDPKRHLLAAFALPSFSPHAQVKLRLITCLHVCMIA